MSIDFEIWGDFISVYTDDDALGDGILNDATAYGVTFNGKAVSRVTIGAAEIVGIGDKDAATIRQNLKWIADNCRFDREGVDAWGILDPCQQTGGRALWLVFNELGSYTLMLPSEY